MKFQFKFYLETNISIRIEGECNKRYSIPHIFSIFYSDSPAKSIKVSRVLPKHSFSASFLVLKFRHFFGEGAYFLKDLKEI